MELFIASDEVKEKEEAALCVFEQYDLDDIKLSLLLLIEKVFGQEYNACNLNRLM